MGVALARLPFHQVVAHRKSQCARQVRRRRAAGGDEYAALLHEFPDVLHGRRARAGARRHLAETAKIWVVALGHAAATTTAPSAPAAATATTRDVRAGRQH